MAAALDDPDFLVRSSEVVQSHDLISTGSQPQAFSIWNMQQSQDDRTFSFKMVSNPIISTTPMNKSNISIYWHLLLDKHFIKLSVPACGKKVSVSLISLLDKT